MSAGTSEVEVVVRADVVLRGDMSPVERAIAIVEDSRATHVEWRNWLTGNPGHPDSEVAGDLERQVGCIENYDEVLAVLQGLERDR